MLYFKKALSESIILQHLHLLWCLDVLRFLKEITTNYNLKTKASSYMVCSREM